MAPESKRHAILAANWGNDNTVALAGNQTWIGDPYVGGGSVSYPVTGYTWTYTYPSKIRLKLSEVERLRAAAKKDKALREVLQKFTGHIEIEVDFE